MTLIQDLEAIWMKPINFKGWINLQYRRSHMEH